MAGDGSARGRPIYDAFVVRLWREAGTDRVLRAEVEHVRTGALARAAGVPTGWVLAEIRARLADGAAVGGTASEALDRTPASPPQLQAPRHEQGRSLDVGEPRRR